LNFIFYINNKVLGRQAGSRTRPYKAWMEWLKHLVIYHDGEGILVNGLIEGLHIRKYSNGRIMFIYNFANDKKHGSYMCWYENGQLWHNAFYINGLPCGTHEWLTRNGELGIVKKYINGVEQN
jgi:antitoxin component YwqK of YwqJK toxin-antitoxin module